MDPEGLITLERLGSILDGTSRRGRSVRVDIRHFAKLPVSIGDLQFEQGQLELFDSLK